MNSPWTDFINQQGFQEPIVGCVKKRVFFKELRDHLDYHFYRSEWETCKKLGLYDDFLVRGIRIEDIH